MIQIAICDDNNRDLLYLKELIVEIMNKYSVLCNIYEYNSGEELLESPLTFHLVFLDIMLSGRDGIDVGNTIYKKNRSIKIIFQTSYGNYCKEATNRTHAFAFLEKPLKKKALEEQLKEFIDSNDTGGDIKIEFNNVKYVKQGKEIERLAVGISVKSILYFEYIKQKKAIKIFTEKGSFTLMGTMSAIEAKMKPLGFETCCRGIIVNLEKIRKIKGYSVFLSNGAVMPLSQRRVSEFKRRVNEYIHGSLE